MSLEKYLPSLTLPLISFLILTISSKTPAKTLSSRFLHNWFWSTVWGPRAALQWPWVQWHSGGSLGLSPATPEELEKKFIHTMAKSHWGGLSSTFSTGWVKELAGQEPGIRNYNNSGLQVSADCPQVWLSPKPLWFLAKLKFCRFINNSRDMILRETSPKQHAQGRKCEKGKGLLTDGLHDQAYASSNGQF